MRVLLLAMILPLVVSCSKESGKEVLADSAAKGIALALECSNPAAIKADILAKLGAEPKALDSVGSVVCQQAVVVILPILLGSALNQIPSSWSCRGDAAKLGLTELAKRACQLIPLN